MLYIKQIVKFEIIRGKHGADHRWLRDCPSNLQKAEIDTVRMTTTTTMMMMQNIKFLKKPAVNDGWSQATSGIGQQPVDYFDKLE